MYIPMWIIAIVCLVYFWDWIASLALVAFMTCLAIVPLILFIVVIGRYL
jgi:hypothetical protein